MLWHKFSFQSDIFFCHSYRGILGNIPLEEATTSGSPEGLTVLSPTSFSRITQDMMSFLSYTFSESHPGGGTGAVRNRGVRSL